MNPDLPVDLHRLTAHNAFLLNPEPHKTPKPAPLPIPIENASRSYWLYSSPDVNPLAKEGSDGPLTKGDVDVCIIGSGITGVSAAYHFAQIAEKDEGWKANVVVLEARDFCSGATGRNGGHLAPLAFHGFTHNQRTYDTHTALQQLALEAHTSTSVASILAQHNLTDAVDLVNGGRIDLYFTPEEEEAARVDYEAAGAADAPLGSVEFFSKEEMNEKYGTNYPAAHVPSHNVYPLKLVTQLYLLAQRIADSSSVRDRFKLILHTSTPVTSITPAPNSSGASSTTGAKWLVHTPRGVLTCSHIIHATNGYASHLLPFYAADIVPTRGQIIATRASASYSEIPLKGWVGNQHFEYWFPRPPGKGLQEEKPLVILGGGRESVEPHFELFETDDSVINPIASRVLRKFLPAVFPGKFDEGKDGEGTKPEWEWTGIMGYTKIGDPFVGPVTDPAANSTSEEGRKNDTYANQYISAGYTGHGMPRAFACAEALASLIHHESKGGKREDWVPPTWLPEHYLTWKRGERKAP